MHLCAQSATLNTARASFPPDIGMELLLITRGAGARGVEHTGQVGL